MSKLSTRIHSVWYDLTHFAEKHPGGERILELVNERDSTVMFESHHPFVDRKYLAKLMSQYSSGSYFDKEKTTIDEKLAMLQDVLAEDEEILTRHKSPSDLSSIGATPVSTTKNSSPITRSRETLDDYYGSLVHPSSIPKVADLFEWPEGGSDFSRELVAEVKSYFVKEAKRRKVSVREATKATPERIVLMIVLASLFLCSIFFLVTGRYHSTLIATPILGWLLIGHVFHDAAHFALSTNAKFDLFISYLFPYFSSPYTWQLQHVIGHHSYVNIAHRDPDVAHTMHLRRDHPDHKWVPAHKNQASIFNLIQHFCFASTLGMNGFNELLMIYENPAAYNKAVPVLTLSVFRLFLHLLSRIVTLSIILFWPFVILGILLIILGESPMYIRIVYAIVPSMLFSVFFMFNTQINHLSEDTVAARSTDWYCHQVITAQNFGHNYPYFYYLWSGGLNMQIEHHLFPTVNHCHLLKLQPIVRRICAKHGIPYKSVSGYWEGIKNYMDLSVKLSVDPKDQ